MGYLQAVEMATRLPLREAVRWHLQHNHFPPYPPELLDLAVAAVERAREALPEHELQVPEPLRFRGRAWVTVADAVESLHLEAFIPIWNEEGADHGHPDS